MSFCLTSVSGNSLKKKKKLESMWLGKNILKHTSGFQGNQKQYIYHGQTSIDNPLLTAIKLYYQVTFNVSSKRIDCLGSPNATPFADRTPIAHLVMNGPWNGALQVFGLNSC